MKKEKVKRELLKLAIQAGRKSSRSIQVGCVIFDEKNGDVASIGSNKNVVFPFDEIENDFSIHAEICAIVKACNAGRAIEGKAILVSLFPCIQCTKALIEARVSKVYFMQDKKQITKSKLMFKKAGIQYEQVQ